MRRRNNLTPELEIPGKVTVTHHEGAIVGTLEQTVSGNSGEWKVLVREAISGLARWTEEQGGLVGHIKASLQTPEGTLIFSCTGDEVHIRESPDPGTTLAFTAIVFFVNEEQLKKRLEAFGDLLRE
jgi:hypothetical protein